MFFFSQLAFWKKNKNKQQQQKTKKKDFPSFLPLKNRF